MILPGIHDSLPISMSKDQPEYMYNILIVHSVLLPSAKPFKGQRSVTPTIVLHSSGHSIPFQSIPPLHSTVPVHRIHTPDFNFSEGKWKTRKAGTGTGTVTGTEIRKRSSDAHMYIPPAP